MSENQRLKTSVKYNLVSETLMRHWERSVEAFRTQKKKARGLTEGCMSLI